MKRITQITLSNYRAFFNEKDNINKYQINLPQGENLLVYGENGSGKSSLFKALEDFFLSANELINLESNIYSQDDEKKPDSIIGIKLSDEKYYEFNRLGSGAYKNPLFTGASKAFLTYKSILKTYFSIDDKDTISPNLFDVIISILLSKIIDPSTNKSIADNLQNIKKSVNSFELDLKDALKEPDEDEQEKTLLETKGEKQVREDLLEPIKDEISGLNKGITSILNDAIISVNGYLNDIFKINIEVFIKDIDNYIALDSNNNLSERLHLGLKYFGKEIENQPYHLFLNEARLSALAICIYLAAIKRDKSQEDNLKILFLDDIFIGLDTSNRLPLLEILKKDFDKYQIFITTYDRYWYELAYDNLSSNWKKIELYRGIINKVINKKETASETITFEVPVLIYENIELYDKAKRYFEAFDYYTAGNCLRKIFEKRIEELIDITYRIEENDLEGQIQQLIKYYAACNCEDLISSELLHELKMFKKILLNPSSHYDLRSPLYKAEVQKAFKVVNKLLKIPKIERKLLFGIGAPLYYKNTEKNYKGEYTLIENLYVIKIESGSNRLTNPLHKIKSWELNTIPFCDKNENSIPEQEIKRMLTIEMNLKKRAEKIKHYLDLTIIPNWLNIFHTVEGKALNTYI
jgi:energy-coupling factor transporter ATP-binding protein EcfA2